MIWVLVFGGVALVGLVTVIAHAVWLAHKASDVFAEATMLAHRLEEGAQLLATIEFPGQHDYNQSNEPESVSAK